MLKAFAFVLVSGIVHWILLWWVERNFTAMRRYRRRTAAFIAIVLASILVVRSLTLRHIHVPSVITAGLMVEVVFVAVLTLPLILSQLLIGIGWVIGETVFGVWRRARRPKWVPETIVPPANVLTIVPGVPSPPLTRRQVLERSVGLTLMGTTGSVLLWGAARGRLDFHVEEVVVRIAGLPRALEGYTIAQISDLHVGAFVGDEHLHAGFEHVKRIKPDLVVATGDLVDHDTAYVRKMADALASLKGDARDGVAAILGNHDHYTGADIVETALRDVGIRALINEGWHVRPHDGGGFALLGVDDLTALEIRTRTCSLPRALRMVPDRLPTILLSHQPDSVDLWHGRVMLQLSGHIHGGQINPGFSVARGLLKYVAGRYQVGSTTLYVNRGFGTSGVPSRVGAPPEVTKIVLIAG